MILMLNSLNIRKKITGEEFDNVRWHKGMHAKIFIEGMGTVIGPI